MNSNFRNYNGYIIKRTTIHTVNGACLPNYEIYKEDDLLTYEIAVNICRDYLGVEPCFKNEDFIIPNDKQLQEPKKHR